MKLNKLINCVIGYKKEKKRLGRGIGSGTGKTCGKGHKGQKARSGKKLKRGFEGGQLPLKRTIPKMGFVSRKYGGSEEVRFCDLSRLQRKLIDIDALKTAKLIKKNTKSVKLIKSGKVKKKKVDMVNIRGLTVTNGVRKIIEKFGGKIEIK